MISPRDFNHDFVFSLDKQMLDVHFRITMIFGMRLTKFVIKL